jgi:hypothetical protein
MSSIQIRGAAARSGRGRGRRAGLASDRPWPTEEEERKDRERAAQYYMENYSMLDGASGKRSSPMGHRPHSPRDYREDIRDGPASLPRQRRRSPRDQPAGYPSSHGRPQSPSRNNVDRSLSPHRRGRSLSRSRSRSRSPPYYSGRVERSLDAKRQASGEFRFPRAGNETYRPDYSTPARAERYPANSKAYSENRGK